MSCTPSKIPPDPEPWTLVVNWRGLAVTIDEDGIADYEIFDDRSVAELVDEWWSEEAGGAKAQAVEHWRTTGLMLESPWDEILEDERTELVALGERQARGFRIGRACGREIADTLRKART